MSQTKIFGLIQQYCMITLLCWVAVACSNEEMDNVALETDATICFGAAMPTTRGMIDDATQMERFKVWGWRLPKNAANAEQVFNAQTVRFDVGSGWIYEPQKPWYLYNTYRFYGLYPDTLTNSRYTANGDLIIPRLDIRQNGGEYDATKSVDVLQAFQPCVVEETPPERVLLQFKHLLTNVNFEILKDDTDNTYDKIVVTSIVIGGMNCIGNLENGEWNYMDTETSYFYTLPNQELQVNTPLKFNNLLMLPQDITEEQPVVFIVQYNYTPSGTTNTVQKYLMTNLPATQDWGTNQMITYKVVIHVDKNIQFLTPTVESWGTAQIGGTIIIQ